MGAAAFVVVVGSTSPVPPTTPVHRDSPGAHARKLYVKNVAGALNVLGC